MKRIILFAAISVLAASATYALMSIKPFLTREVMATQHVTSLKFRVEPSPKHRFDTLKELVDRSPDIVVGVPVRATGYQRSRDDRMVFTDYEVQVLENLKGNRRLHRSLTLRVPGGSIALADGKTLEVSTPGIWKRPEVGRGYIFFLTRRKDSPSVLVGGPQGLFELAPWPESFSLDLSADITNGRVVIPQVRESDRLMKSYKGKNARDLINQVKTIVGPLQPAVIGRRGSKQSGSRAGS